MNLSAELYLRFRLARLSLDSTIEWSGWTIRRDVLRFYLTPPGCEDSIPTPRKGGTIQHEMGLLSGVGHVVAAVLGAEYASELAFKAVTKCGVRYQAWDYDPDNNRWIPVLYADTAQDAHDCYQAWKSASHALNPRGKKAG